MIKLKTLLIAAGFAFAGSVASAATIVTSADIPGSNGNDCSGDWGQGFENCVFDYEGYDTPIIAKTGWPSTTTQYNYNEYDSLDGDEVTVASTSAVDGWYSLTYTVEEGEPSMSVFIIKGGSGWTAYDSTYIADSNQGYFTYADGVYTLYWTETNTSHVSIYNGGTPPPPEVPLPAAGFLLLGGLGALGFMRRRKT